MDLILLEKAVDAIAKTQKFGDYIAELGFIRWLHGEMLEAARAGRLKCYRGVGVYTPKDTDSTLFSTADAINEWLASIESPLRIGKNRLPPRKKYRGVTRNRSEFQEMIDNLVRKEDVTYLDQLVAIRAWAMIRDGHFTDRLIKHYPADDSEFLKMGDGEAFSKSDFKKRYGDLFE